MMRGARGRVLPWITSTCSSWTQATGHWRKSAVESDPVTLETVLPGISAVPWGQLRSGARATAGDVPGLLAAIASVTDDSDPTAVRDDLEEHLAPDGLLFEVTAYAVPFLVRIAQDQAHRRAAFLAQLILESIAYGEPSADELAAGNDSLFRDVGRGLAEAVEFLYRQFSDPEPKFRAQAISLLAPIDGHSARFRDLLAEADDEDDELVTVAVRDAREYLADIDNGERLPLPTDGP